MHINLLSNHQNSNGSPRRIDSIDRYGLWLRRRIYSSCDEQRERGGGGETWDEQKERIIKSSMASGVFSILHSEQNASHRHGGGGDSLKNSLAAQSGDWRRCKSHYFFYCSTVHCGVSTSQQSELISFGASPGNRIRIGRTSASHNQTITSNYFKIIIIIGNNGKIEGFTSTSVCTVGCGVVVCPTWRQFEAIWTICFVMNSLLPFNIIKMWIFCPLRLQQLQRHRQRSAHMWTANVYESASYRLHLISILCSNHMHDRFDGHPHTNCSTCSIALLCLPSYQTRGISGCSTKTCSEHETENGSCTA